MKYKFQATINNVAFLVRIFDGDLTKQETFSEIQKMQLEALQMAIKTFKELGERTDSHRPLTMYNISVVEIEDNDGGPMGWGSAKFD